MFGKIKSLFAKDSADLGTNSVAHPAEWPPARKIRLATEEAIAILSRSLTELDLDCGKLGSVKSAPPSVSAIISDCTTSDDQQIATLASTKDFGSFSFVPQLRLFFILNGVKLIEDLPDIPERSLLLTAQLPEALIDAHLLRMWIQFANPIGKIIAAGNEAQIGAALREMQLALVDVMNGIPSWFASKIDIERKLHEWAASGFPAVLSEPLTADTPRINQLPMNENAAQIVRSVLADIQSQGSRERIDDDINKPY